MCHHNHDNVKVASEDWHIEFQVSVSKTSCFLFIAEKGSRKKKKKKTEKRCSIFHEKLEV